MDHAFGRGRSLALGVEEELLLVDARTHALDHRVSELLPRLGDAVKPDVYEAEVETASPVCSSGAEAAAELGAVRERMREAGATLIGCGIHPDAPFGDAPHVPGERYEAIADAMRGFMRRTPTCALHVHVGMPDPETAIRALAGLRSYLPVLQGLAAHSPYWHGIDSGFASARAQLFRAFPRAVIPPAFTSWAHYEDFVERWLAAGDAPDYTFLWWDIRPHPRLGTVELRAMDAQSRLGAVAGLSTLVHGLALAVVDGRAEPPVPGSEIVESSFRAGRDGLEATLRWDGSMRPLRELAQEAIGLARGALAERGADGALVEVERILREGSGADRMRAAHAAGGMRAVLELLVAEAAEPGSVDDP
ncbi:MAG TPA: YbdK family carboxylate-amine ligase [Solirubrobacteraceae bacterium]|nr:YbdK family carboxylate-amine ligase [Solirubrobacteraceae bacterium]